MIQQLHFRIQWQGWAKGTLTNRPQCKSGLLLRSHFRNQPSSRRFAGVGYTHEGTTSLADPRLDPKPTDQHLGSSFMEPAMRFSSGATWCISESSRDGSRHHLDPAYSSGHRASSRSRTRDPRCLGKTGTPRTSRVPPCRFPDLHRGLDGSCTCACMQCSCKLPPSRVIRGADLPAGDGREGLPAMFR